MKLKHLFPVVSLLLLGLAGCSRKPLPDSRFAAKNIYSELRDASVRGAEIDVSYPSGVVFARNHLSAGDTDGCFTTLLLSKKWVLAGSSIGYSGKIRFSERNWEDKLLIALWNHSCADKSVAAIASESFDFLKLESFIRKMQARGFESLFLVDLIVLDSNFKRHWKPGETVSWAKLRAIIVPKVRKSPEEYATLHIPSEKKLNWVASKIGSGDTSLTAQAVRAKSGERSLEYLQSTFETAKPLFDELQTRFPNRHVRFHGLVKLKVVIDPLGHVVDVKVVECAIKYPALPLEMIRIVQAINFGLVHTSRNETVTFSHWFTE